MLASPSNERLTSFIQDLPAELRATCSWEPQANGVCCSTTL